MYHMPLYPKFSMIIVAEKPRESPFDTGKMGVNIAKIGRTGANNRISHTMEMSFALCKNILNKVEKSFSI